MPIVRMPDGQKIRFPDNMSREEIRGMILQNFPMLLNVKNSNTTGCVRDCVR